MKTERLRVSPLGSMDQRWAAEPTSADAIINMRHSPRGAWAQAKGYAKIQTIAVPTSVGRIHTAAWFSQHNGARNRIIIECDSGSDTLELRYWDYTTGSAIAWDTGRKLIQGPNAGTSYYQWGNWICALNGYDEPVRWNGREKVRIGFGSAPAPPGVSIAGHDLMGAEWDAVNPTNYHPLAQRGLGEVDVGAAAVWRYGWAYTHVNDLGQESPLSAIAFLTSENPQLTLPTPALGYISARVTVDPPPGNVRGIRLYRTINVEGVSALGQQGSAVYFHSAWATGAGLDIIDDTPDRELGTEFDRSSVGVFPGARIAAVFKGALFTDSGPETPDRIHFSTRGAIEQFPPDNFFPLGGGRPTGMYATKNALVVFRRKAIDLIRTNDSGTFEIQRLTSDAGAVSHRVLAEVPGVGLLFLTDSGPHILIGALANEGAPTRWEYIGAEIDETWRGRVNIKALENAHAAVHHADREVWIQVPADGDDRPTLGLVYHYDTGGWSIRTDYPAGAFIESPLDGSFLFGSYLPSTREGLWVITDCLKMGGEVPVEATYRTAWLDWSEHRVLIHFMPYMLTQNRALTLDLRVDRRAGYTSVSETTLATTDSEVNDAEQSLWGAGVWGPTKLWHTYRPVPIRVDVYQAGCREAQFRIKSGRMELLRYDIELGPSGSGADIKKLTQL